MGIQLLEKHVRHSTPAVTGLPSLCHGKIKPKGQGSWKKRVLPAGAALAIWVGLSAAGWAVIFGLLYWIS